eukprot:TRINITY_DN4848_c0_g1_i3.p1 TRINITY_DN4848_c0_g1~~TRINITY_DN4848_c0_g1_i3.p1  ORF type:complete len:443 (+),score=58.32 TRINITY_DN4848_c0_g1_i3:198-1526(+)
MNNKRNSIEGSPTRETRAQKQQRRNNSKVNAPVPVSNGNPTTQEDEISPTNPELNSVWEIPKKFGKVSEKPGVNPDSQLPTGNNQFDALVVDDEPPNNDPTPKDPTLVNSGEDPKEDGSPGLGSSGIEDDEGWRREESDGEEDIDLDDATWTEAFQDALTTIFWFSVVRVIPNNTSTGWATYISKVTRIPFFTLEGITKIVRNGSVIVENKNLSDEQINRLKEINTDTLLYSPRESIGDAEATLLVYVAKTNDKLSNIEVASNSMHLLKKMAEKKKITIDKIVSRFVENAKFPCLFLIFKNALDAFGIFDKGNGRCKPLYEEKLGVVVKPIPETLRCTNQFKWRKLSVKDIGYNEDMVIERMHEFSAYEKYNRMIGLICHNKNFKTGGSTRNATIIAKPSLIFKMAEVLREKKPKGIGQKGATTIITAELVSNEVIGNRNNK